MKTTSGRLAAALLTLTALGGCTSSVTVVHTVPPQYSIVPAKVIAVIGTLGQDPPDPHEDYFLDLFVYKLRRIGPYEVLDERDLARRVHPGHGLTDPADLRTYLQQTKGEVVAQVTSPEDNCSVTQNVDEIHIDAPNVYSYDGYCKASLDLINARTGALIGHIDGEGGGHSDDGDTAWNDARNDSAQTMIDGFMPEQLSEQIDLDDKAPFFGEGMAKIKKEDLGAARALWEGHLAALPDSAPLLYNLGAVSEALRDREAAEDYYTRAAKAAPGTARYTQALDRLDERAEDEETSKKTEEETPAGQAAKQAAIAKADAAIADAARARAVQISHTAIMSNEADLSSLLIPAGTFTMGCTDGDSSCAEDEKPAHTVTISRPFYLAFTLTMNFQYQKCVDAGACHGQADQTKNGHPVVNVTWNQAREFCAWTGGRLPTEAEWEYAARGGVGEWRFPWGREAHKGDANFVDNGGRGVEFISLGFSDGAYKALGLEKPAEETSQVGTFPTNGYGLDDMAGNVLQWTADWKGPYTSDAATDPTGLAAGTRRILRGGSWVVTGAGVRVSVRYSDDPEDALSTIGFRCARDEDAPDAP
jgi:formylglycine-generating enzyme required for sulfatase activity